MQGAGIQIEKALRTFTKEVWDDFAGDKSKADGCICGDYRGLQMTAFKFKTTPPTLNAN